MAHRLAENIAADFQFAGEFRFRRKDISGLQTVVKDIRTDRVNGAIQSAFPSDRIDFHARLLSLPAEVFPKRVHKKTGTGPRCVVSQNASCSPSCAASSSGTRRLPQAKSPIPRMLRTGSVHLWYCTTNMIFYKKAKEIIFKNFPPEESSRPRESASGGISCNREKSLEASSGSPRFLPCGMKKVRGKCPSCRRTPHGKRIFPCFISKKNALSRGNRNSVF